MEYHFGSNNLSDIEVIDPGIKKRILTSNFSFPIYIGIKTIVFNIVFMLYIYYYMNDICKYCVKRILLMIILNLQNFMK